MATIRTLANQASAKAGEIITAQGWVHSRRNHGGLIFIDLRDHTGLLQLVFNPEDKKTFELAASLRDEFVIEVSGQAKERADELKNSKLESGDVELVVANLRILNKSETLPIQIHGEQLAGEDLRLKYRYLDLRRDKMQNTLKRRSEYYTVIRDYMRERDFIEVATPILANSSPEGARDFLVPSRVHQGKFYALPQAPQQFKQLLMVGGVPRYYQIATCFRDEDPRADRLYGDFYQLDLEMSFIEDGEIVRQTMEPLVVDLVKGFAGKRLLKEDIPRIPYQEAMDRFGTDKPDLRFDMELVDLTSLFDGSKFGVFANAAKSGVVKAICVKGGASLSRSQIDQFTDVAKSEGASGLAYLTFVDGEIKSPIAKFLDDTELKGAKDLTGADEGDIVFFCADKRTVANKVLGRLRNEMADHFDLKDPELVALAWIVDFPFYEWNEGEKKLDFGHNPFSMPKGGVETLEGAEDKLDIVADQYDMVMNGYEVCSGAVRNHNPEVMYKAFEVLGYDEAYVDSKFGAMVSAFKYGAPPHAGCAFGVDRIFMALMNEDNIREVVAFPKNGSGVDVMMNSPSEADPAQLKELSLG